MIRGKQGDEENTSIAKEMKKIPQLPTLLIFRRKEEIISLKGQRNFMGRLTSPKYNDINVTI